MSPSPGTSRCDDATVPTAKSLTCTSRMRSTPSRIVALERALGPARVDLHAHAVRRGGGRGRPRRVRVCTKPTSTRSELVCSIANGMPRVAASASTGAQRGLERVGGLLPGQRRERAGREHEALGADVRPPCRGRARAAPVAAASSPGSARWNGPRPMRFVTAQPAHRVGDQLGAVVPAEPLELRHRDADACRCRAARQNARSSSSAQVERARSRSRTSRVHAALTRA